MGRRILPDRTEPGLPAVEVGSDGHLDGSVEPSQEPPVGPGRSCVASPEDRAGEPHHLDIAAVSNACGVPAERVTDPAEPAAALERAMAAEGPYLLDIEIEWSVYVPQSGSGGFPLPEVH